MTIFVFDLILLFFVIFVWFLFPPLFAFCIFCFLHVSFELFAFCIWAWLFKIYDLWLLGLYDLVFDLIFDCDFLFWFFVLEFNVWALDFWLLICFCDISVNIFDHAVLEKFAISIYFCSSFLFACKHDYLIFMIIRSSWFSSWFDFWFFIFDFWLLFLNLMFELWIFDLFLWY